MKQFVFAEKSRKPMDIEVGENFKKAEFGKFKNLNDYVLKNNAVGIEVTGKVFLHDILDLTGMEVSINVLPVGFSSPFKHKHKQNEELFIFIKGHGLIEIDSRKIDVQEGTIIRIDPNGIRWIENGSQEELIFIVIQAKSNSLEQFTLFDGIKVFDGIQV